MIEEKIKFKIIGSSNCWYGWPIQFKHKLIKMGLEVSEEGKSICYLVDTGHKHPDEDIEATPINWVGLKNALDVIKNNKLDLIFYSTKWFGEKYLSKNDNAFYLPFSCDTKIFKPNYNIVPSIKVTFVGNSGYVRRQKFMQYIDNIEEFKVVRPSKPIYFKELAEFYSNCLITLNQAQFGEINCRAFEAAACGVCVVQERVDGIEELFKEDEEIILWDTLS